VLAIMRSQVGTSFDPDCFAALEAILTSATDTDQVPAAAIVPALDKDCHQAA
jgi:HD-GYP domain-containing protein (c-di-GMP phosphodiesterase class II)